MPDLDWSLPPGADPNGIYVRDTHHVTRPLPPLVQDVLLAFFVDGLGWPQQIVNGYLYSSAAGAGAMPATIHTPPAPQADPRQAWEAHYLPIVLERLARARAVEPASLSTTELAIAIEGAVRDAAGAFAATMFVIGESAMRIMALVEFLEGSFPGDGSLRAMTLAGGFGNETASLGAAVQQLAALAREAATVRDAVLGGSAGRDDIAALSGSGEFVAAFDAFLAAHGRSTRTWFDVHQPTWDEQPGALLHLVATTLRAGNHDPDEAAHRRTAMLQECVRELPKEKLADFEHLLARALDYVPVIEGRARWQMQAAGCLRAPVLALGERLVSVGVLESRDDVFHLHLRELQPAATGNGPARDTIASRREAFAAWGEAVPPLTLGAKVPLEVLARVPVLKYLIGIRAPAASPENELSGTGASRGVVTARARVVLGIDDADRLEPGEILVCPFTAPPWTPLFSIASAVVTDAGGILSHAAIEAREYGIPAIVGATGATSRIPDGATITVDGGTGIISIHA